MSTPFDTAAAPIARQASEAARNYLRDLMLEKAKHNGVDMLGAHLSITGWIERHGSKDEVSENIDRLKSEGFTGRTIDTLPEPTDVPAGRYAIDTAVHAVNGTAFYRVDRPNTGKWAGYVFVKQIVGPEERRLSQKQGKGILAKIKEVGAEAASARYGQEIGHCGICGLRLTNDESRERGIGPICAGKMGW